LRICNRYLECFRRTKAGESSGAGITLHMRIYALTGQRTEPGMLTTVLKFLSRSLKYVDSIRNYINGFRVLHLYLDYPFPDLENFVYKLLIKGLVKTTFYKTCFTNHSRYFIGYGKVFRFIWSVRDSLTSFFNCESSDSERYLNLKNKP
jgi:hypothetical protein